MKQEHFKRFDMQKLPMRQQHYLRPITWLLSFPAVWRNRTKIIRENMAGVKPPYLLLCNHNAFIDFKVMTVAIFPARANYVVAIDGYIKREWLMRLVGCICKRKYTNDISVVRQLSHVIKNGDVAVLFPEARYSICGINSTLPDSLGKLVKILRVPVVTLIMHGHHLQSPFWNLSRRGTFLNVAKLSQLFTAEEAAATSVEEINERIRMTFTYDDFAWQKENHIPITYKDRAKGLHKVLYQCSHCRAEYQMDSDGDRLWCHACGASWHMSEYGELMADQGTAEFSHIPAWFEWQRAQVRADIEQGTYSFSSKVTVESLPNAKGFIGLGEGTLTHNMNGFRLEGVYEGEPYVVEKSVSSMYSVHIEYNYLGKGRDCVDINTLTDTYYLYPFGSPFAVTKLLLATEELYAHAQNKTGGAAKNCR